MEPEKQKTSEKKVATVCCPDCGAVCLPDFLDYHRKRFCPNPSKSSQSTQMTAAEIREYVKNHKRCPYCRILFPVNEMVAHLRKVHSKEPKSELPIPRASTPVVASSEANAGKRRTRSSDWHGYADPDGAVECVLCHQRFQQGQIERHLIDVHKASGIIKTEISREQYVRVIFYQGGAPGLGK